MLTHLHLAYCASLLHWFEKLRPTSFEIIIVCIYRLYNMAATSADVSGDVVEEVSTLGAAADDERLVDADDFPLVSEITASQNVVPPRDVLLTSQAVPPSRFFARVRDMSCFPIAIGAIEVDASSPTNGTASARASASANATASAAKEIEDAGRVVADSLVASL